MKTVLFSGEKYNWRITDRYGFEIGNKIFEKHIEDCIYLVTLSSKDLDLTIASYDKKIGKLSFYSLGHRGINVDFNVSDMDSCEEFIDKVCDGNNLSVMDVHLKEFSF